MSRTAGKPALDAIWRCAKKRAQQMTCCAQETWVAATPSMRTAVIVIPIAIAVPAVVIFVPPSVIGLPAILSSFLQFVPRVLRLLALPTMVFDGFVNPVIGSHHAILAFPFIRTNRRCTSEHKKSGERRAGQDKFPKTVLSRAMFCFHPILLGFR
jgi:hypothetical protein